MVRSHIRIEHRLRGSVEFARHRIKHVPKVVCDRFDVFLAIRNDSRRACASRINIKKNNRANKGAVAIFQNQ
jgi:hypothetical protein